MEEAARARSAAREAIEDITPAPLRTVIDDRLARDSMIPGVLTLLSAQVVDGTADPGEVERRAAGVQLIYEGLRLTRTLVTGAAWLGDAGSTPEDVDVLAADVLVARGFRLLARTEASAKAVDTVQAFGREQTDRHVRGTTAVRSLEANVFELAVIAGATAAGHETPLALRQYVVGLAEAFGDPRFPPRWTASRAPSKR
ncbi:hypothetical protein ACFQH6_17920 [Halobacteriaceae archaeon GCM10025711]